MKVLIIIFLAIVIGLILRILLYKKDIDNLYRELKYLNDKDLDITKLRSDSGERRMVALIYEINRTLEEKQRYSMDYNKKEMEIKEMIASISHDLRTPLTSIKGYVDMMEKRTEDETSLKYIDIIKSRSNTLESLIGSFYDLSKLELREYEYKLEYIDIKELLMEVLASFYDKFNQYNIEPVIELDNEKHRLIGDYKSLERVFINLIDNGIKYSSGYFKLRLREVESKTCIEFINSSKDLNQENIDKIFDRFFVVDTSRQSESTGLGLYITRKLVEDMGYTIDAGVVDQEVNISIVME